MNDWKLLVTRETVLLERFIRIDGYREMFGNKSEFKVRNLFVVNNDSLTAVYELASDIEGQQEIIRREYKNGYLERLIPSWEHILSELKNSTNSLITKKNYKELKRFISQYKLARGIVYYTEYVIKYLESKNNKLKDLNIVGKWHEQAEVESCAAWDKTSPFFISLSEKYGISQKNLMFYLPSEFLGLIQNDKLIDSKKLSEREKYYVLWLQNNKIQIFTKNKAKEIEKSQLLPEKIAKTSEIAGIKAYSGKVVGIVRIVNTKADIKKIKQGDVLVSIMTTPRLLHAVKKASAIVTNEGGLLCHAAIIARELGVPCIVGTKNATQVLKDGDKVEVDAEKGIITIVEK
ncbi:MAG: PEP-utilizing enzyme [bacterium]